MDFKDLNEISFLTVKTDFLLDIREQGNDVYKNLELIKSLGIDYDTVFKMVLKAIESLKGTLVDGVIEKIFLSMNEIYGVNDENVNAYISLLNCYSNCDIENYNLRRIYNDEFVKNATVEFNMMFAAYYLNVLVERYAEIEEINRVNHILKDTLVQFKVKYGRE